MAFNVEVKYRETINGNIKYYCEKKENENKGYLPEFFELFKIEIYLNFKIATNIKDFAIIKDGKFVVIGLERVIEFNEILKAYNHKKLTRDKIYAFKSFTAKLTDKNALLSINFYTLDNKYQLDYTEAQILSAQISKVIQKTNFFEDKTMKNRKLIG